MGIDSLLPAGTEELTKLLHFSALIDRMTQILRRNLLVDGSRRENDAEHSWHIAVMAILFEKYAPENTDIGRVCKMCIVHDLVEIYAGDTFAYDIEGNKDKEQREKAAADRLFRELPDELNKEIRGLWEEFDAMETVDAKYASCMDRLQPLLHNSLTEGHTWKINGKTPRWQLEERMKIVKDTIPELTSWINACFDEGVKKGWVTE